MNVLEREGRQGKNKQLDDLGLPKLPDMREEFPDFCDELGVK
jgi:hypothetical protein